MKTNRSEIVWSQKLPFSLYKPFNGLPIPEDFPLVFGDKTFLLCVERFPRNVVSHISRSSEIFLMCYIFRFCCLHLTVTGKHVYYLKVYMLGVGSVINIYYLAL